MNIESIRLEQGIDDEKELTNKNMMLNYLALYLTAIFLFKTYNENIINILIVLIKRIKIIQRI